MVLNSKNVCKCTIAFYFWSLVYFPIFHAFLYPQAMEQLTFWDSGMGPASVAKHVKYLLVVGKVMGSMLGQKPRYS